MTEFDRHSSKGPEKPEEPGRGGLQVEEGDGLASTSFVFDRLRERQPGRGAEMASLYELGRQLKLPALENLPVEKLGWNNSFAPLPMPAKIEGLMNLIERGEATGLAEMAGLPFIPDQASLRERLGELSPQARPDAGFIVSLHELNKLQAGHEFAKRVVVLGRETDILGRTDSKELLEVRESKRAAKAAEVLVQIIRVEIEHQEMLDKLKTCSFIRPAELDWIANTKSLTVRDLALRALDNMVERAEELMKIGSETGLIDRDDFKAKLGRSSTLAGVIKQVQSLAGFIEIRADLASFRQRHSDWPSDPLRRLGQAGQG